MPCHSAVVFRRKPFEANSIFKPVAVIIATLFFLTYPSSIAQHKFEKTENLELARLLDEVIEAYGGCETIRRFEKTPRQYKGVVYDSTKHPIPETLAIDGDRNSLVLPDGDMGFDGNKHWSYVNGIVYRFSNSEEMRQPREVSLGKVLSLISDYKQHLENFSPEMSKTVGSVRCDGLKLRISNDTTVTVWIRRDNHLIRGLSFRALDTAEENDEEIQILFDNYQKQHGFMIAYEMSKLLGNKLISRTKWNNIEIPAETRAVLTANSFEGQSGLSDDVTVPFAISSVGKLVIVGDLNGYNSEVMVDTGAATTLVSAEFAEKIHLETSSESLINVPAMFSDIPTKLGYASRMSIGHLKLEDINLHVEQVRHPGYPVTLGMDILRNYKISVDFQKRTLTFSEKENGEEAGGTIVPMQLIGQPYISAKINDSLSTSVMLDTGSSNILLILDGQTLKTHTGEVRHVKSSVRDINFINRTAEKVKLKSLEIAGLLLRDLDADVVAPSQKGNAQNFIGLKVLQRFRKVTLDFPTERLFAYQLSETQKK